jgi:hypothetical protein
MEKQMDILEIEFLTELSPLEGRKLIQRIVATVYARTVVDYLDCTTICDDLLELHKELIKLSNTDTGYINEIGYYYLLHDHEVLPHQNCLKRITYSINERVAKEKEFVYQDNTKCFFVETCSEDEAKEKLLKDFPAAIIIKVDNYAFYTNSIVKAHFIPFAKKI